MENRNFKLDTEWNMIHYSEMPNGFGILIIGDGTHFVNEHKSSWMQNEEKLSLLNHLRKSGYTVFYSNLYGKHWGAFRAVEMAERLYQHIVRNEILNSRIHIIAEGIGAKVALELMQSLKENIRSVIFINPIFSLKFQIEQEQEHKFFYKRLLKEVSKAYNLEIAHVEEKIKSLEMDNDYIPQVPIKIIHVQSGKRSYQQFEYSKRLQMKWEQTNKFIESSFILPEKKQQLGKAFTKFFNRNEREL